MAPFRLLSLLYPYLEPAPHIPGSKAPKGLAVGAAGVPCALGLAGMAA